MASVRVLHLRLQTDLDRATVDRLVIFSTPLGDSPSAYTGRWEDACTLVVAAGNTTGATTPQVALSLRLLVCACLLACLRPSACSLSACVRLGPVLTARLRARSPAQTGGFSVRLRDDFYELLDAGRRLRLGSVTVSPKLEGTFGAAQGTEGRLDALRAAIPELALKRYMPPRQLTIDELRVGPLRWHPITPYDAEWAGSDRSSECDGERTDWMAVGAATGAPGPVVQRGG